MVFYSYDRQGSLLKPAMCVWATKLVFLLPKPKRVYIKGWSVTEEVGAVKPITDEFKPIRNNRGDVTIVELNYRETRCLNLGSVQPPNSQIIKYGRAKWSLAAKKHCSSAATQMTAASIINSEPQ